MQYPVIEAITAGLFALVFWVDFYHGALPLEGAWPWLIVQLVLVGTLVAATVIDARLFIIPLQLPWTATLAAIIVLPLASIWLPWMEQAAPQVGITWVAAAVGASIGLLGSLGLMRYGILPRSFNDPESDDIQQMPEQWLAHPHPRREVLKEVLFLGLPMVGWGVGYLIFVGSQSSLPLPVRVLGGVLIGYLVGGGVVWGVRILGTLAFGKEAMGLGDVHLLASIGAVLGWLNSVVVFFVAPFFALAAVLVMATLGAMLKGKSRVIPYGPYLAGAAVLVMVVGGKQILQFFGILR